VAGLKYWLWLSGCRGLSTREKLLLLEHFGSPEGVYYADEEEYLLVGGIGREQAAALTDKATEAADRILGECDRLSIRILTMQDADYPARLRDIFEPPCLLYVKGKLPVFDEEAAIAVVGTRKATPYGVSAAEKLAFGLAGQGALVVSGAARGIDTAAHRGALRAGKRTVAVLGGGIDVVYPEENTWLYRDIAASGALISEYPPGTPALGRHFPVRNRILSGLCVATLVVEAPERSGALITANTALEQGRDVFAVPGPIDAPNSRGCNRLIAEGAGVAMDSETILREYEAQYPHKLQLRQMALPHTFGERPRVEAAAPVETSEETAALPTLDVRPDTTKLTDDQLAVVRALRAGELLSDDIIERTALPTRRVLSALTVLEIDGYVVQSGGRRFSLNARLLEE